MADPTTWFRPCTNRDLFQVTCRGMTPTLLRPIGLGEEEPSSGGVTIVNDWLLKQTRIVHHT